jgi:hypothetical protein
MLELWWYQRVVDFDTSDQVQMVRTSLLAWHSFRESASLSRSADTGRDRAGNPKLNLDFEFIFILLPLCALTLGLALVRRPAGNFSALPRSYARALALLRRRGLPRTAATTARDYAKQVEDRVPATAAGAFSEITEAYLAERFGRTPQGVDASLLKTFRRELPRRLESRSG